MSRYPSLLSTGSLGALHLPNRVLMAAMTRGRARRDGTVTELATLHFTQRASAGLLCTEAVATSPEAVAGIGTPGMWSEAQAESWRVVVQAVHAAGGRIALQLMHAGRLARSGTTVSSSPVAVTHESRTPTDAVSEPRALELNEIPGIVAQFASAARRAREVGFDAIEIHACNGCLLDQFLRDGVNARHDRYGGSPENRARLLLQVAEAVAKEMHADRTGVRLSPLHAANDMHDADPLLTFGTALRHLASLELAWTHLASMPDGDFTRRLRDLHGSPFVLNGGFTAESADAAIRDELACAVSFGQAFIANPDLVERFEAGAPLAVADPTSWYGTDGRGYTDYPALSRDADARGVGPHLP
ncbi:MAG: alkene reductase [Gemmatimonadota bacterium]